MSGQLVTVATFNNPVQAALARNYLENSLIRAFLLDEETVAVNWAIGNAVGGIKLQVHAADAAAASFMLGQLPTQHADAPQLTGPDTRFADPETIEELRAEREPMAPKDDAVDRLFRATVLGLVLLPLQLYALWLLMTLPSEH